MVLKGKGGIQYNLEARPFAQGGEGLIFNIDGHPDKVSKLYKQGKATSDHERKLIKMIMTPPSQDVLDQIAWPLDVLYDTGQAVGFVMHKFNLNEDLNVMYEYGSSSKYPEITWGNKIKIAKNLCVVLNAVHEAGHICGDLNPKNISVDPNTGHVTFVDTDSYHITDGNNVYRCNVGMPEYLPREIQVKMQNGLTAASLPTFTQATDNFALAVHIFQLLMNGCHPFACITIPSADSVVFPDTSDSILKGECPFIMNVPGKKIPLYAPPIDILPDEIQKLFKLAFVDGHTSPSARPSAETWYYALDKLEKNLKKCRNASHHEYLQSLSDCPWCAVDARFSSALSGNKPSLKQSTYTPPSPVHIGNTSGNSSSSYTGASRYGFSGYSKRGGGKMKKGIIITASALLLAVAAVFGVTSYIANNKIDNVESLISNLPDSVSDYSYFEQEIIEAYSAYTDLDPKLQKRVENAEKLLVCMDGVNLYRVELIRQVLTEISEESVQNTDILERLNKLYTELTNKQRASLTAEENQALEQASYLYVTINGINELLDDVVGKYNTLSDIKKNYVKLTDHYKNLVYNYSELDSIDQIYNLQKSLNFTAANGGWAVSATAGAQSSLSGDVIIPSEYKGQPVTTIPEGAFSSCTGITSITIPDSVTSIGKKAFSGCLNLQSITLPFVGASRTASGKEGVFGYIFGDNSYSGGTSVTQWCSNAATAINYIPNQLKKVTITDAVQLGYGAFYNCSMLTEINLNSEIVGSSKYTFLNCSGITTINIPNITVISESMFEGCSSLTTLTLSESVTGIEAKAFKGCLNLTSLNSTTDGEFIIGNSVQSIGKDAFTGCIQLQSITLPFVGASRTASGNKGVFGYIFGTYSYSGGTLVTQWCSNGATAANYIPNQLKEVTITDAAQLGYGAFYNCSMLTKLTINSGAKNSVGDKAFTNCVNPKWN
ncbi:MAG: leucine-rich repeat protein [Lachnospiraceae bacterium]|nr:leucine-rich repeat protein [Lachnospiraceae bacterium]